MDKFFQQICDYYPHYKINTKVKKKIFYFLFTFFKFFIKGPIKLNFNNFFFLAYPQRKNYSRSLLRKASLHDEEEINFFIKNINDNDIFIDCGANQGFYTIPVAGFNKNCEIISFEPSKQEMQFLKENILINNFNNIKTYEVGIGDKEGILNFQNDNLENYSTKGGLIIDDKSKLTDYSKIKVTTLDKFINNNKIKISKKSKIFIKIDIEGYDINAVYGSKDLIKNHFTVILVEFSKMAVASSIYIREEFEGFLSENQLVILNVNGKIFSLNDLHEKLASLKGNHQVCGNFLIMKRENMNKINFKI